jgi:hypothetical protein
VLEATAAAMGERALHRWRAHPGQAFVVGNKYLRRGRTIIERADNEAVTQMTTARSTASVRSGEQPWHPAGAEGGEEPAPTQPQTELHASGSTAWPFDGLTAEDGDAGGPMGSSCTKSIDLLSITVSAWAIPGISEEEMQQKSKEAANDPEAVKTEPSPEKAGISEDEMQQKSKGAGSDPEHVDTEPCPEKEHGVPIPKRGAFPTPKAIIESSPQYAPQGSGTTGGESVTKPVSNAEKKRH